MRKVYGKQVVQFLSRARFQMLNFGWPQQALWYG